MSEPKRYKFRIRACDCVRREHLEGKYAPSALIIEETKENCGWVSYEDYALLKAEVDAWKEMVADSGVACNERARENQDLENQIARLKAEVGRLTKVGDAMAKAINEPFIDPNIGWDTKYLARCWQAAKKGGQP